MPSFLYPRARLSLLAAALVAGGAQAALLDNGSFESVNLNTSAFSYCYLGAACAADTVAGWTGDLPLIRSDSGAWGNPSGLSNWNAGFGTLLVGLQEVSFIQQSLTLAAGNYQLSWFDAGRSDYAPADYEVHYDGALVASQHTTGGQGWSQHSVSFHAGGNGVLLFQGKTIGVDGTAFLDNMSLSLLSLDPSAAVPEPASAALVMLGLAGVAATRRRSMAQR